LDAVDAVKRKRKTVFYETVNNLLNHFAARFSSTVEVGFFFGAELQEI
jgi:hypothetical protein